MTLEDIKKRWEEFRPTAHHEIGTLIRIAEAAKHYWDKYNSDCPLEELNKAETKFSKALAELEGDDG